MSTIPPIVALPVPLVVFAWQLIGASRTFNPGGGKGSSLANLIGVAFAALLFNAWLEPLNAWLVALGWLGLAGALGLFEWARRTVRGQFFSYIFSDDSPTFLCTAGPFASVRHPFYASYLLAMGSTAAMMPTLLRGLVVLAMAIYFLAAAIHEERKFAASGIAADYEAYKHRTGRFLPKLRSSQAEDL